MSAYQIYLSSRYCGATKRWVRKTANIGDEGRCNEGSSVVHLQLARGCVLLMESGMTVACWTEVWVSCCHAGGSRICWVPLGQAC